MIPAGAFTPSPVTSSFLPPYDTPFSPLAHIVPGGIALGDTSRGRQYQNWEASYSAGSIQVKPSGGAVVFTLAAPSAQTISLSFDSNMGIVLAWMNSSLEGNLYYYDTLASSFTTRVFTGLTSCKVCVDDSRDFNAGNSDVIFAYTKSGGLFYRQQRDRYDVEYTIGATSKLLQRCGPSVGNRLQFEVVGPD